MRLAAQMIGGFYPAPPEAVAHAATRLRAPTGQPFAVLDPCAGEGAAISQLANLLGSLHSRIHAIEVDDSRAATLRATLSEAHVLAPASFFGCRASLNCFGLIWLNPPFDNGYAGLRVEDQFLRTATQWLAPGGVMALVCPESVAEEYSDVRCHFASHYQNCTIVPFPKAQRRYNEVIVFGHKRARPCSDRWDSGAWEAAQAPRDFVYHIPPAPGPSFFQKVEPTEAELQRMLARSPLRAHLTTPSAVPLPAPPLALGIGHVALLLASGHLDGVVEPEGGTPHVVRGTSRKREFVSDITDSLNDDGTTTTRTIISERIELVVRTVDHRGVIQTFMDSDAESNAAPESQRRGNGKRSGTESPGSRIVRT